MQNRRAIERRIKPHEGSKLDRRQQPYDSVEGQLQRAQKLFQLKRKYGERKIKAVVEHYKKFKRELTIEELQEILTRLDIAQERLNERKLAKARDLALIDSTTGMYWEKGFKPRVKQLIQEQPHGTMFFIDLNNLKTINDSKHLGGHIGGDKYLSTFGQTMIKIAEKYKLVICRAGGDEFLMYSTSEKLNDKLIERIVKEFRKSFIDNWETERLNFPAEFAIGWARKEEIRTNGPEFTYNSLRDLADARMYANKTEMKKKKKR